MKKAITTYTPYSGFYDLRAFDIPKNEFIKLWRIQEFLYTCDMNRRKGIVHPQLDEIKQLSANYQAALFRFPITNQELI